MKHFWYIGMPLSLSTSMLHCLAIDYLFLAGVTRAASSSLSLTWYKKEFAESPYQAMVKAFLLVTSLTIDKN